jgi:poly(glycerol-phosphate) alpha-glucosyltransferase
MSQIEMPDGRYLSSTFIVGVDAGGQTRALLMRTRILAAAGLQPGVITFSATHDYDERRQALHERGLLDQSIPLLNIYEHYRDHGWGDRQPTGEGLEDLSARKLQEETHPDGTPWRAVYRNSGHLVYDYLRPDGSPYLRIPEFEVAVPESWQARIQPVAASGEVLEEFRVVGNWFRRWIRDITADDERAFVFIDSRFLVPYIVPMRGRRIHLIYVLHNIHVQPPRRWDSRLHHVYRRVLGKIGGMDAMVTLTERQRDDIAARRGRTSNLFVVPNPIDAPAPPPGPPQRDPNLVTIVARLEAQKHLTEAIAAFERVVEVLPDARLDIYGDGGQRELLECEIERRGLQGSVALRGYDPRAQETLWRSSVFLMTSSFEGYPLSTLESMAHGCPVVSYDIKYGPREQISDGVDGFLVPAGDLEQLAARVIELLRSPELVARMSEAALRKAAQHGPDEFLADWADVLRAIVAAKPQRARIDEAELELTRLRAVPRSRIARLLRHGRDFAPALVDGGALELTGVLKVDGATRGPGLDAAELGLSAVHESTGDIIDLPLTIERDGNEFRIRSRFPLADVVAGDRARLRLRLVWRNASWQTRIMRPAAELGGIEVTYAPDEVLRISRP